MKQLDLTNVGGRIRQARNEASVSMKQLSEIAGVTHAYMGMVERGEKKPSNALLKKIAQVTGTSYAWLESGLEEDATVPADSTEQGFQVPIPISIDIPIFLSLSLLSVPGMTKEKLAAMFCIPVEAMDDILCGRSREPEACWMDYLPLLARQMDMPDVCRKIRDIDMFLQNEDIEKKRKRLRDSVKQYAGPEYRYSISPSVQKKHGGYDDDSVILYSERIVLQKNESPQDGAWHFIFYQLNPAADESDVDSLVKEIVDDQLVSSERNGYILTFVLDNEEILKKFENAFFEFREKKAVEDSALAEISPLSNLALYSMSLLLADSSTWEAKGKLIPLDNKEDMEEYD